MYVPTRSPRAKRLRLLFGKSVSYGLARLIRQGLCQQTRALYSTSSVKTWRRLLNRCWMQLPPRSSLWRRGGGGEWHLPVLCLRKCFSGWWFQRLFIFTPTWGRFPTWRAYFSKGLKPPTSSLSWRKTCFFSTTFFWAFCSRLNFPWSWKSPRKLEYVYLMIPDTLGFTKKNPACWNHNRYLIINPNFKSRPLQPSGIRRKTLWNFNIPPPKNQHDIGKSPFSIGNTSCSKVGFLLSC